MRILRASLSCLLVSVCCHAQDSLSVLPSGDATYYYNGVRRSEGKFIKNKRNGLWKFYNASGQLITTETYVNGQLDGPTIQIDSMTGRFLAEGNYKNGNQTGEWKYYFSSGNLRSKVWKDRGVLRGPAVYFDSTTGNLLSEGHHIKGLKEGTWKFYFNPASHLYALETYQNGELNGLSQYYDSVTFKLISEGNNRNNKRDGKWIFYFTNGKLKSKECYKNGVLHGYAEFYDSVTTEKIGEGHFINGKKHGKWKMTADYDSLKGVIVEMYKDDKLNGEYSLQILDANIPTQSGIIQSDGINGRSTTYYPGTSLIEYVEYTTHNNVDSVVYYDSALQHRTTVLPYQNQKLHGLVKLYYLNGNLKKSVTYKNNVKDGLCAEYDSATGSRICLGYNTDGKSSGRWHSYFINTNTICSEVLWENDSMNGPAVYFDSLSSSIIKMGQYKSDKREGIWQDFYPGTNKLKSRYAYYNSYYHGNFTAYDSLSGEQIIRGMYQFGEREGDWTYYNPYSGHAIRKKRFNKGLLSGKVLEMDSSGNIISSCDYLNNKIHGTWEIYHPGSKQLMLRAGLIHDTLEGDLLTFYPSGKRKRIEKYQYGTLKSSSCYDEDGNEINYYPFLQNPSYLSDAMNYIANTIRYPKEAEKIKREGEVLVGFYVNEDGTISEAEILKGIGAGCDDEALRVINSMRGWIPAMIDGIPFRDYVILPVNFKL